MVAVPIMSCPTPERATPRSRWARSSADGRRLAWGTNGDRQLLRETNAARALPTCPDTRVLSPWGLHHLTQRSNNQQEVSFVDDDRRV